MTYYRALASTVVGSHAKLLVLFFPLSYVVHREDLPRWQHLGVTDIARQIEFNRAFCDYLIRQNLDCIDITEDLRAAAATARLYYRTDIHWTAAGNLVAARAVATHLHHSP